MTDTRPQDFWQFLLDEEAHTKLIMRDWRAARYDCITYLNNIPSSGSPSPMPGSGGATPLATTCPALHFDEEIESVQGDMDADGKFCDPSDLREELRRRGIKI